MKEVLCSTFELELPFVDKWKRSPEIAPSLKVTIRAALQTIEDEFRSIKPAVWVDMALRQPPAPPPPASPQSSRQSSPPRSAPDPPHQLESQVRLVEA